MLKTSQPTPELKQRILRTGIIFALALLPSQAWAQAGGAFGPIETALQLIIDFINGPFGRSVAVIAVTAAGILAFAGRLSWMFCGAIVIGIGLVFGAPTIVDTLIGAVN